MVPDRRVRVEHPISHLNCQRRCGQPSNISLACGSQMAIRSTSSKLLTSTHRALRRRQLLLRHAWRATSLEALARSICARLVVLMPAARLLHSPGRFLRLETVRNPVAAAYIRAPRPRPEAFTRVSRKYHELEIKKRLLAALCDR